MDAVTQVTQSLRRYLREHPQACDTAIGIATWWPVAPGGAPLDVVLAALRNLIASGEVECAVGPDGQTVYRAAPGQAHEQAEPDGS